MKVECSSLLQFPSLKHAFFNPQEFHKESGRVELALQSLPLVVLKQVHGNTVFSITEPLEEGCEGDGLVTNLPGIALGILTADCGPVLFCDPKAGVIGACHAGWRGAKAGIIAETVKAMVNLGAERPHIHTTLGPTIQQHTYEVGPEFPDLIGEPYETYFYASEQPGHHYFNLPFYIQNLLSQEDLSHIHDLQINTFDTSFASRRRSFSQGYKIYEDNLSLIAMV